MLRRIELMLRDPQDLALRVVQERLGDDFERFLRVTVRNVRGHYFTRKRRRALDKARRKLRAVRRSK